MRRRALLCGLFPEPRLPSDRDGRFAGGGRQRIRAAGIGARLAQRGRVRLARRRAQAASNAVGRLDRRGAGGVVRGERVTGGHRGRNATEGVPYRVQGVRVAGGRCLRRSADDGVGRLGHRGGRVVGFADGVIARAARTADIGQGVAVGGGLRGVKQPRDRIARLLARYDRRDVRRRDAVAVAIAGAAVVRGDGGRAALGDGESAGDRVVARRIGRRAERCDRLGVLVQVAGHARSVTIALGLRVVRRGRLATGRSTGHVVAGGGVAGGGGGKGNGTGSDGRDARFQCKGHGK